MSVDAINSANSVNTIQQPIQKTVETSTPKEDNKNLTSYLLLGSLAVLAAGGIYYAMKGRGEKAAETLTQAAEHAKPAEEVKNTEPLLLSSIESPKTESNIVENIEETVEEVIPKETKIKDIIGEKLAELRETMNAKGYFKLDHKFDFEKLMRDEDAVHMSLEEFKKVGKFEKGKAILSTGEKYTGYIEVDVKNSEYNVKKFYLRYEDGKLVRSTKEWDDSRYTNHKNYFYNADGRISNVENLRNYHSYYYGDTIKLERASSFPKKGVREIKDYSEGKIFYTKKINTYKDENGIINKQETYTNNDGNTTITNYIKNSENKFEEVSKEKIYKGTDYTEYSDKNGVHERRYKSGAKDVYIKDELAEADAYIPEEYRIGERQKYEIASVAKMFDKKEHHIGYRRVIRQHSSWDHDFNGRPSEWQTNTITEILDKDKKLVKTSFVEGERFDRSPIYD